MVCLLTLGISSNIHIHTDRGKLVMLENGLFVGQKIVKRSTENETQRNQKQETGSGFTKPETVYSGEPNRSQENQEEDRAWASPFLPVFRGKLTCLLVVQIFDKIPHVSELVPVKFR